MTMKYDFTSNKLNIYSNIRFIGLELRTIDVWRSHSTNYRLDRLLTDTDLPHSELQTHHYSPDTPLSVKVKLLVPRCLTIIVDTETSDGFKELHSTFLTNRLRMGKTTNIVVKSPETFLPITNEDIWKKLDLDIPFPDLTFTQMNGASQYDVFSQVTYPFWEELVLKDRQRDNIMFLDIDGVLLNHRTYTTSKWQGTRAGAFLEDPIHSAKAFDQYAIAFLRKLAFTTGLSFVLTSQWRNGLTDYQVMSLGKMLGIPIIGKVVSGGKRVAEVTEYLQDHKPSGILSSIDDEDWKIDGINCFKINPRNGLSFEQMEEISTLYGVNAFDFTDSRHKIR